MGRRFFIRTLHILAAILTTAGLTTAGLTTAGLTTVAAPSQASAATYGPPPTGRPPTVTGADIRFAHPPRTLRPGTAAQAGLVPRYIDKITDNAIRAGSARCPATAAPHPGTYVE